MKIKLAIFDVDGTLFNGNLGVEFIKILVQKELFTKEIGENIFDWYGKYKNGLVEKAIAVDKIYALYGQGMKGMKISDANKMANETWKIISQKMFDFVPKTINFLKSKGYLVFLLSGSPIEMVRIFGNELNINEKDIMAGEIEVKNNIYTGNIVSYPGSAEQKIEILLKLIREKNIDVDWQNSIAMGDNERDLKVLEKVGHPMAFNPNEELKKVAQNNDWKIVDENNIFLMIASYDEIEN